MSKSAFPGSPDHAATLRRMNLLVVLLVVSNIVTGALGFYLLKNLDEKYSELIQRSVPVLNDMQTLTARSTKAMRATDPSIYVGGPDQVAVAAQRAREAIKADQALRESLSRTDWMPDATEKKKALERAGETFSEVSTKVVGILASGRTEEAGRVRENELRPAFEQYQAVITKTADDLQDHSLAASQKFTAGTASSAKLIIGFAGWPVIVLFSLLILTVLFVVVLMFVFRGKELGDMP